MFSSFRKRLKHPVTTSVVMLASFAQMNVARADGLFSGADLFSAQRFSGHADLRLGVANGEPSWLDEGFGKARFGADNDGADARATLAEASLV